MPKLPAVSSCKDIHWRKILPTFLKLAFSLITLLAIILSIRTWESMRYNLQLLMHEEENHLELAKSLLQQELGRMSIDLRTFSGTPSTLIKTEPPLLTRSEPPVPSLFF